VAVWWPTHGNMAGLLSGEASITLERWQPSSHEHTDWALSQATWRDLSVETVSVETVSVETVSVETVPPPRLPLPFVNTIIL
jgi:hypothetical protein